MKFGGRVDENLSYVSGEFDQDRRYRQLFSFDRTYTAVENERYCKTF